MQAPHNSTTAVADELDLQLLKPVKVGDLEYSHLSLTEPTMGQLRKASKAGDGLDILATLIQLNAKVPMAAVDQLCQRDMEACSDFFARFSPPDRAGLTTPLQN